MQYDPQGATATLGGESGRFITQNTVGGIGEVGAGAGRLLLSRWLPGVKVRAVRGG